MRRRLLLITLGCLLASPALARDTLGMFGNWGAFRDASVPRCYAIALSTNGKSARDTTSAYADIASWPRRHLRHQFHVRLGRRLAATGPITLTLGDRQFALTGAGYDVWATDPRMDAAITAALRSASTMTLSARDIANHRFSLNWALPGVASAMDAAALACAG